MKIIIEAGANNGIFQSRSLRFSSNEEFFFILIEPHPIMAKQCAINRSIRSKTYQCALVSSSFICNEMDLYIHDNYSAMNASKPNIGIDFRETIKVPTRTLQSILNENSINEVEWLFLDTEGYEAEVLKGIDFAKTKFLNIELESHSQFLGISELQQQQIFEDILRSTHRLSHTDLSDGLLIYVFRTI